MLPPLPNEPGVYLYKNADQDIIYVGKAKNLRKRVQSYFNSTEKTPKTEVLVKHIRHVEFIIVDNEVEALLLENKLIKQHQPKYNVMLKDAKTYAYIKITDEKYPRILSVRKLAKTGTYFGPYTDAYMRAELQRLAVRLYKLRVCKTLPKRACLNYHIGLCSAPCIQNISKKKYDDSVEAARRFLKGNRKEVLDELTSAMQSASRALKYEVALEKKRQIEAIRYIERPQKVDLQKGYDQNVVALRTIDQKTHVVVFSIARGVIKGKRAYVLESDDDIFESFIKMYYSQHTVPREIIVNAAFWKNDQEKATLESYLMKFKGSKITLTFPQRGEKRKLVQMAEKNIAGAHKALLQLQDKLNLSQYPRVIECFDISNLSYDYNVGGMTQWVDGLANRSEYRRYEIKGKMGQDDFASMHEVIYRRYRRLIDENLSLPNLILIDGGPGQLSSALAALSELSVKIPLISLAKREEEIYLPGESEPRAFDKNSDMLLMLRNIRDSVHTFALSYNRKKREMRLRK